MGSINGKRLSKKQKLAICESFASKISDISKYINMNDAAHDAGMDTLGAEVSYYTIRHLWYKQDEELGSVIAKGLVERAESYSALATQTVENIEEFWKNERGRMFERMQAVNRAKLKIEHYMHSAQLLSPELYGDYIHQIKKVEQSIKEMQSRLDNLTDNTQSRVPNTLTIEGN